MARVRIDIHAHHYDRDFAEGMQHWGSEFGGLMAPGAAVTLDQRIELLDDAGIDTQVLCAGAQQPYLTDPGSAQSAARFANDYYKNIVERYEGRFATFGCVPLPHVDLAIQEATRCLDELRVGIGEGARPNPQR